SAPPPGPDKEQLAQRSPSIQEGGFLMSQTKRFTNENGAPVADNTNIMTAGPRGPALLQDIWLLEKLAHFDREVIPERRLPPKAGAADAERDIRGTALKFYTEEGNWDIVGNNTPVFFFRDPLRFPDLNHAIK